MLRQASLCGSRGRPNIPRSDASEANRIETAVSLLPSHPSSLIRACGSVCQRSVRCPPFFLLPSHPGPVNSSPGFACRMMCFSLALRLALHILGARPPSVLLGPVQFLILTPSLFLWLAQVLTLTRSLFLWLVQATVDFPLCSFDLPRFSPSISPHPHFLLCVCFGGVSRSLLTSPPCGVGPAA